MAGCRGAGGYWLCEESWGPHILGRASQDITECSCNTELIIQGLMGTRPSFGLIKILLLKCFKGAGAPGGVWLVLLFLFFCL